MSTIKLTEPTDLDKVWKKINGEDWGRDEEIRALIALVMFSGIRLKNALELGYSNCQIRESCLELRNFEDKGSRLQRTGSRKKLIKNYYEEFEFAEELYKDLVSYAAVGEGKLFKRSSSFYRKTTGISFHGMRVTLAIQLCIKKVQDSEILRYLGWSDSASLQRYTKGFDSLGNKSSVREIFE